MAITLPMTITLEQRVAIEQAAAHGRHPARDRLIVLLSLLGLDANDIARLETSDFICSVEHGVGLIIVSSAENRRKILIGPTIIHAYHRFLDSYPDKCFIAFSGKRNATRPIRMTPSGIDWVLIRLALQANIKPIQRAVNARPAHIPPRRAASRLKAEMNVFVRRLRQIATPPHASRAKLAGGNRSVQRRSVH